MEPWDPYAEGHVENVPHVMDIEECENEARRPV